MSKEKTNFFKKPGVQSLIASLICIILGLFIAFIVLFLLYKRDADKEDDKKLIKVPFINDVMAKTDSLIGKIFKKKAAPANEPKDE